ncbi:sentrin-specific protease-like isoform X2 [Perca flavescens]|uniref:sentrin-specific protease-like isoform X2 n=1 Tax=Perca flavescens TaxID=8167 RepID=UPI00106E631C|nr:sentrin-specific protease-like isoform X2 [Perca flavescens]
MAALSAYCQTKDGSFSIKSTAHFVSCSLLRGVLRLLTIPKQMGLMRKPMITSNVQKLWSSKDTGQVEAVVGPYKIYDASLRTLSGHGWLSDEIIDAYLHCIMKLAKIPVHCLDAVLGSSVFHHGRFRVVQKMKLPTASTWICPVNVGGHWILVIVKMDEKSLLVIDHLEIFGRQEVSEGPWTIQTAKHNLQQDGSSCGVLILMFAELILQGRSICVAQTDTEEVSAARVKIAVYSSGMQRWCGRSLCFLQHVAV